MTDDIFFSPSSRSGKEAVAELVCPIATSETFKMVVSMSLSHEYTVLAFLLSLQLHEPQHFVINVVSTVTFLGTWKDGEI